MKETNLPYPKPLHPDAVKFMESNPKVGDVVEIDGVKWKAIAVR
jgi:hypothetical protein